MRELRLPDGPLDVVGVAAHPDDLEIGCGGLLLRLAGAGARLRTLTMTGDEARIVEARAAAAAFLPGTEPVFGRLPDTRLPGHWEAVKGELHAFAAAGPIPDLVLAPRPGDAHQDHAMLGQLAATAWRDSLIWYYEIPKWDGDMGRPEVYLPVPEILARRKVELLDQCYPSQRTHDWWDSETFLGLMRLRGVECRARYAEAFAVRKMIVGV